MIQIHPATLVLCLYCRDGPQSHIIKCHSHHCRWISSLKRKKLLAVSWVSIHIALSVVHIWRRGWAISHLGCQVQRDCIALYECWSRCVLFGNRDSLHWFAWFSRSPSFSTAFIRSYSNFSAQKHSHGHPHQDYLSRMFLTLHEKLYVTCVKVSEVWRVRYLKTLWKNPGNWLKVKTTGMLQHFPLGWRQVNGVAV